RETTINDNLFVAGESITVSGNITGNLIAFGEKIVINGTVGGAVIAGGSDVTITGQASDMMLAGGNVIVNGIVKRDLLIGAGKANIGSGTRVGTDLFMGCGEANIAGKIYRNVKIGSSSLVINENALIKGNLDYSAENTAISKQANIVGTVSAHDTPEYGKQANQFLAGFMNFNRIVSLLAILLLAILTIIFFPNQVKLVSSKMTAECWKSFGWGILALIATPFLVILLCVTLIGIPLGLLLLVAYIFGVYITIIFVSVVIGQWILEKFKKPGLSPIWAFLIGFVILKIVALIPIIGWIAGFILFLWGFGALITTRFVSYKEAREKGIV
ncbi:MAG: hypothetical protein KKA31_05375, partial [Candidatus Margulisbacteria bacterium]|nr:hypothetical protein [Candidatus Margulisiibacteriota bacterium]